MGISLDFEASMCIEIRAVDLRKYHENEELFFTVLDFHEKRRADSFKFPYLRRNYILSHGILRYELAKYLDVDPSEIAYRYGPFGKPYLTTGEMYFNMSHSMDMALYGFSFQADIGVDIEYIKPLIGIEDLPLSALTIQERNEILDLPICKQKEAFYKLWTRREAYYKAIGSGLQSETVEIPPECRFLEPHSLSGYIATVAYLDLFGKITLVQPSAKIRAAASIAIPPT